MSIANSDSTRKMFLHRDGHATSSVYAVRSRREAERSQDSTQCLQVMFLSEPACLHQRHLKAHLHLLSMNSLTLVSTSSNLHVSVRAQSITTWELSAESWTSLLQYSARQDTSCVLTAVLWSLNISHSHRIRTVTRWCF